MHEITIPNNITAMKVSPKLLRYLQISFIAVNAATRIFLFMSKETVIVLRSYHYWNSKSNLSMHKRNGVMYHSSKTPCWNHKINILNRRASETICYHYHQYDYTFPTPANLKYGASLFGFCTSSAIWSSMVIVSNQNMPNTLPWFTKSLPDLGS